MKTLPEWNKPGTYSMGRDPLGMQAASVRLYTELVPGITNVTNRIRYYSFYCWVIREFEKIEHTDDEEKWKKFIRRAEAAYVLSCVAFSDDDSGGMAGSDWARLYANKLSNTVFDFTKWTDSPGDNGQYLKAARGNFGQFYVSSMIDIGMLIRTGSRIPILTEDYGIPIAEAFEEICPTATQHLRATIIEGSIDVEQAKQIAIEANPGALIDSNERNHLKAFLLGTRKTDETANNRQESLWNCLNALRHIGVNNVDAIRTSFYTQDLGDTKLSSNLLNNLNLWQAYQANELCHIALELILNDVSHEVNMSKRGIEPKHAIENVIVRAFSGKLNDAENFQKYASELCNSTSLEEDCQTGDKIVYTLAAPDTRPEPGVVLQAFNLICILFFRWHNSTDIVKALDSEKNFGRSLAAMNQSIERNSALPGKQILTDVVRQFVVKNHLHIAGQKLANSGTFTYRFLSEDGLLKDVRLTDYKFTTPRLGNLLWFAQDVGLIENDELTASGEEFLNAC